VTSKADLETINVIKKIELAYYFTRLDKYFACAVRLLYKMIYIYNRGSLHNNISEKKQTRPYGINIVYQVSTLHVSTLTLGHHQAYDNTSISS
jgi:hypothetical protein